MSQAKPTLQRDTPDNRSTLVRGGGRSPLFALSGPVIGIDLGTVNSCVAYAKNGVAKVISIPGGYQTVPSIVHIDKDGEILVGHAARERMVLEPDRAVYGSKRFLGRPFESKEIKSTGHFFNYPLVAGPNGRVAAQIGEAVIELERVAGHILERLKKIAEVHLECPVQRAVVTVPAYFGETQRQAVREAGRYAGLHVERILNEPTAAAVAYGFGRGLQETVLVYDLGGGTFDASVLRINGDRMEVLASDGDPFLGGADFDDRLTEFVLMSFEREHGFGYRDQQVAVQRTRFAVEMAKIQLSEATVAQISLPYITQSDAGPVDLKVKLTRDLLENLTEDLVERTLGIVQSVLDTAKVPSSALDDVILVGGQTRSPQVRRLLQERFDKKPCIQLHPDEAVALGAARIAEALYSKAEVDLVDVLPASIRVGLRDNKSAVLLPRQVRLPAERHFEVPLSKSKDTETRIMLFRGEAEASDQNTLLGVLRLPGVAADASNSKATVTLTVSADGLLSTRCHHPAKGDIGELDVLLL